MNKINTTSTSAKGDPATPRKVPVTDSRYKMPSLLKAALATIVDPVARGQYKRAMIEADMYARKQAIELAKKRDKKKQTIAGLEINSDV